MPAVVGELLYTPLLAVTIIIISSLAISIVINKRSAGGLIGSVSGNATLIYYISTSPYSNEIDVESTWANRVVYISCDKANLLNIVSLRLFDPSTVQDGTTLTIFNSPSSSYPARLSIQWTGSPGKTSTPSINVSLGTGQGVTLITERRIGSHYITQISGGSGGFEPPDLTPSFLQPRDWKVYRYYGPQLNMCSLRNGVSTSSYGAVTDTNSSSPCGGQNLTNSGIGYDNYGATSCTSYICQCPNPTSVYPPASSAWCAT